MLSTKITVDWKVQSGKLKMLNYEMESRIK